MSKQLVLKDGIVTDDHRRTRVLQEIDRAFRQAAQQQQNRAEGDYSPDPKAGRFPVLAEASAVPERVAPDRQRAARCVFQLAILTQQFGSSCVQRGLPGLD
jgi:hypothetical protein